MPKLEINERKMSNKIEEKFIIDILNSGFKRAAQLFSQLIGEKVSITNNQSVLLVKDSKDHSFLAKEEGYLIVLTTQIIGDITGKSFLILSEVESQEILKTLDHKPTEKLKEGFLLEIDNVLSATVIADISNELNIEVYGDIPYLFHIHANDLQDFMKTKSGYDDKASTVFSNTTFHFDIDDDVHPQFVWEFSDKIFDMIPHNKLQTVQ